MTRHAEATFQIATGDADCTRLDQVRTAVATGLSVSAGSILAMGFVRAPAGESGYCWQYSGQLSGSEPSRQLPAGHARCATLETLAAGAVARADESGTYGAADVSNVRAWPLSGSACWQVEVRGSKSGYFVAGAPF